MFNIKKIGSDQQNWTIKQVVQMMDNGTLVFDSPIQRNDVWNQEQRSLLIHSAIYGYDIGNMCLIRTKETNDKGKEFNKYSGYDGRQRCTTFFKYLHDEFALSENTPSIITLDEDLEEIEYDIAGRKYSELEDFIAEAITSRSLSFRYFEDLTVEEEHELFFRKNNGSSFKAIELMRVKAKSIEAFKEIANHDAIQQAVSDAGRNGYVDELISMQAYAILYQNNPSFLTKDFRKFIQEVDVTTSQMNNIINCLDKILELYNEFDPETKEDKKMLRKIKARTHLVSLIRMANGIENTTEFVNKAKMFFSSTGKGASIDVDYNTAAGTGSAKPENVRIRIAAIDKMI